MTAIPPPYPTPSPFRSPPFNPLLLELKANLYFMHAHPRRDLIPFLFSCVVVISLSSAIPGRQRGRSRTPAGPRIYTVGGCCVCLVSVLLAIFLLRPCFVIICPIG
jgi:hypothetical protein